MKELIKIPTQTAEQLKSVLVIVLGFSIIAYWLRDKYEDLSNALFLISFAIGILSLVSKLFLRSIIWAWFSLAMVLGFVMSRVLLSLIFYLFLFPIAMLSRIGSKNGLQLKKPSQSVFIKRNHVYTKEDLINIW